jgi:serine/threonine-protein kinase HipA
MESELHVYMESDRAPVLVGRLWARERTGRESSSFTYDPAWIKRRGAFALAPSLPLVPGAFHAAKGLHPAFSDSAPDAWGRKLMLRQERARARMAKTQPRTLFEIDFLAGVDDTTRLGAVRFKDANGKGFITNTGRPVPPLIDLPKLLSATGRIERDRETDDDLLLVLAPGTSLGGARPKATVRDGNGQLMVAKFPKKDDDWPVTLWEAVLLKLAADAGISVPVWRLDIIAKKPVLLLRRFDRGDAGNRIPFMSAMTALDASDHGDQHGYLEILDVLRQQGSRPEADAKELWRRVVFNILVSNTDDHLRNHAFLKGAQGWHLSPAYDMNPCPVDVRPRVHALAIDETDPTASIETALAVAIRFGLSANEARTIAGEVRTAVANWRAVAKSFKLTAAQMERMASAFEHDDAKAVLPKPVPIAVKAPAKSSKANTPSAKPRKSAKKR